MVFINIRIDDIVMQNVRMLVGATLIAVASIAGLNVAQVVYATGNTGAPGCPCGSGNPHAAESDNPNPPTNPQGKIIGDPHDIESGVTNGNSHFKT
jgi:hypothetical protein